MSADWQKLDNAAAVNKLEQINPFVEPIPMNVSETTVRERKLPFYKNVKFYEMTDLSAIPGARKYALADDNNVFMVNWTNAPIYAANEYDEFELNDKSIKDYVKFFFAYVRGRHGRFIVVETFEDIKWQNEPPAQGRKVIQEMLHPVTVLNQDPDGTYNLEVFMIFKDSLFRTLVHVNSDGQVAMSDEELKVEGMPIIQDVMMA
jgi:hypothetical protein|tara:strand:- start:49 stop:660 length:612 start_codon:yes stop_codon:yes gene_type:complete